MAGRLNDPDLVAREYESEERFLDRRLDRWCDFGDGADPRDVAIEALREVSPRRVFEAGPGPGEFAERVAHELGADVTAVDVSPRMVELTRARGVAAHVGTVEELPFPDGSFDCAVANWMLYHVADLDRGLAEIARVLRPGGRLVAIGNSREHMRELWALVEGEDEAAFCAENGAELLAPHFERIERRDARWTAVFPTREALRGYLAAYEVLEGPELAARADELPAPFQVTGFNVVFVADKRA